MCECFVSLYIRDIINARQTIHAVRINFNTKVFNIGLYHDTYGAIEVKYHIRMSVELDNSLVISHCVFPTN